MADIYVDPSIAANSGAGTVGDPYGDLQYALNSTTQGASGDWFHIKSGTDEILTAELSIATYGTPASGKVLGFRGYTSSAGDGGIGGISGNGSYSISTANWSYVSFVDMHLHNTGANTVFDGGNLCSFYNCEVDNNTFGHGIDFTTGYAAYCYVHNVGGTNKAAISAGNGGVIFCTLDAAGATTPTSLVAGSSDTEVIGSLLLCRATTNGANLNNGGTVINNTIVSEGGNWKSGVNCGGAGSIVANNIIIGFSESNATGVSATVNTGAHTIIGNAFYNNTTNIAGTPSAASQLNNVLSGDPFLDAANDDYRINGTVTGVTDAALPTIFKGHTVNVNYGEKGALQAASSGGGGIAYPVVGSSIIRGVTL